MSEIAICVHCCVHLITIVLGYQIASHVKPAERSRYEIGDN